jgi:hypothetical protein
MGSDPWINSDAALQAADSHGGSAFGSAHPGDSISMFLWKGAYAGHPQQSVWQVTYMKDGFTLIVLLNAADGTYIDAVASGVAAGIAPNSPSLLENYPNPFNPTTTISYSVATRAHVRLRIVDPLGREVAALVDGTLDAGAHQTRFDAGQLPSGIYTSELSIGSRTMSRQMILMK